MVANAREIPMARKSGLPWHKRQLSALRDIVREGREVNDPAIRENLGYQFIGACRTIAGSTIPAYHRPLAEVVMQGKALFLTSINTHVEDALEQIIRERKRVQKKRAATAAPRPATGEDRPDVAYE